MDREIQFCTTDDGVRIAYCIDGDGPDIVCCPDFIGSFSLDNLIADQMGFWRGLWSGRRVIRYDMRGTGLSQRDVGDVSHDGVVRDLEAVVRAAGADQFTLWASTLSGPRAIAYSARHPHEVRRLVLHRTFARAKDLMSEEQARSFAELARLNWRTAAQVFADLPVRQELPEAGVHQAQMYAESTSGEFVSRLLISGFHTTDVTALLPQLRVPTLVLHRSDDRMFGFRHAQNLAASIPQARLVPLSMGILSYLEAGRIREVLDVLNEFIADGAQTARERPSRVTRSVQTVLFTDIVGHTEMMRRLGDAKGRSVLREHERITREALSAHGGTEVKTDGDSFMASFASVSAAVECAVDLQRAFSQHSAAGGEPILVRMGLNVGEPIEEDGDFFGSAVILGARIKDQAGGGEILVPEAVRHMLSGKDFLFSQRGDFALKGFEDPVRLYEVRWRK